MWCVERELATNVSLVIHMLLYLCTLEKTREWIIGSRGYIARVRWDCESRGLPKRPSCQTSKRKTHPCLCLLSFVNFSLFFFFTTGIEWQSVIIINDQIIPLISNSGTGTVSAARVLSGHSTCNLSKYKAWTLHLVSLYVFLKQRHIITIVNGCPESDMPGYAIKTSLIHLWSAQGPSWCWKNCPLFQNVKFYLCCCPPAPLIYGKV